MSVSLSSCSQDINVCEAVSSELDFVSDISLTASRDGNITALVGYFDIFFEKGCDNKVSIKGLTLFNHWSGLVSKCTTSSRCGRGHWCRPVHLIFKSWFLSYFWIGITYL